MLNFKYSVPTGILQIPTGKTYKAPPYLSKIGVLSFLLYSACQDSDTSIFNTLKNTSVGVSFFTKEAADSCFDNNYLVFSTPINAELVNTVISTCRYDKLIEFIIKGPLGIDFSVEPQEVNNNDENQDNINNPEETFTYSELDFEPESGAVILEIEPTVATYDPFDDI